MGRNKRFENLVLLAATSLLSATGIDTALAQDKDTVDTSSWECSFCALPSGHDLNFDLGALHVSDDSFWFGRYTGLNEAGFYAIGDLEYHYWGDNGNRWAVYGDDLGLDSRSLVIEGGRQGKYELRGSYSKLPNPLFDTAQTPFIGAGTPTLTLPTGWVTASSTGGMTELNNSLVLVPIEHERETYGLGLTFVQNSRLQYNVDYRREERDGTGIHSGNFISLTSILPEPIDYTTDELDAEVSYADDWGQLRLAYYASMFDNGNSSLTWDDPYTPLPSPFVPTDIGRTSLPPDNDAHQISLSGVYRFTANTRIVGNVSVGEMEQDEAFLPYTINSMIMTTPLPMQNLAGKVDTTKYNLRLDSRPWRQFRFKLAYDYDDRDNRTPKAAYDFVESDSFLAGTWVNLPYSFERSNYVFEGDVRIGRNARVAAGFDRQEVTRTFQEVDETEEDTAWLKLRLMDYSRWGSAWVKLGVSEREGSGYQNLSMAPAPQNPLMRKYNMADRDRDFVEANVTLTPSETVDLGFNLDLASDDYDNSVIGLQESDRDAFTVDLSLALPAMSSLTLVYSHEEITSSQTASSNFSTPNWLADNKDTIDTASIGFRIPDIRDKLDLSFDYTYAESQGETEVSVTAGTADVFPTLSTRLNSAKIYLDYRVNDRYTIRGGYYYEKLTGRDWTLDGVAPDTMTSVLSLGSDTPQYEVSVIGLSFTYSMGQD